MFFSDGTSHSKGVMILINPSLDLKVEKRISDQRGRFIILKLLRDNTPLVLVNVYAPNDANQQVNFFTKLNHQLQEFALESFFLFALQTYIKC